MVHAALPGPRLRHGNVRAFVPFDDVREVLVVDAHGLEALLFQVLARSGAILLGFLFGAKHDQRMGALVPGRDCLKGPASRTAEDRGTMVIASPGSASGLASFVIFSSLVRCGRCCRHLSVSGMTVPWWRPRWCSRISYRDGLSAIRATAAQVGGFPLFTILVYVADEDPPAYAGVGTQAL